MRPIEPRPLPRRASTSAASGALAASAELRASDTDLLLRDRVAGGDPDAAEELVARHLDGLYEFVHYRVGGDRARAEDVVQDTFVVALERMASFDGRASLHTWLTGIARNKLRSERRKRRPRSFDELLLEADPEIDALLAQIERTPLPEWILERQETQDLVGATLSSLSPEHRTALIAKYVDEESVDAIAARLGKGQKATESLLHRARLAFGKVFTLLARKRGELEP